MKTSSVAALALSALALPAPAGAECRLAQIQFTPEPGLQMAIWLEDSEGHFIATLFVTRATATYGLGNRPGRADFNTNYLWPYGRRDSVLPVWAHRRFAATGIDYPQVVFQNGEENNLSHPLQQSSEDPYYCQPMTYLQNPPDGISCVTEYVGSDKGVLSDELRSLYPPRQDIQRSQFDSPDVERYAELNDLDEVSSATPRGGEAFDVLATLDPDLPPGPYVVWVEASRELDYNEAWSPTQYPAPTGIPFNQYGDPFRGQPSVVWQVPIEVNAGATSAQVADYAGYGDITGATGELNPPDESITTVAGTFKFDQDGAGSRGMTEYPSLGAARLQLVSGDDGLYKVRVTVSPSNDAEPPATVSGLVVDTITATSASFRFIAPGDDGMTGQAAEYEIRRSNAVVLTAENFESQGLEVVERLPIQEPGSTVSFELTDLHPETRYFVGVRAKDECQAAGGATIVELVTPAAEGGEVDACFVATAAWGSLLEQQVGPLRRFRDRILRKQVLGEIFVQAYYTFGPAVAEVIEPSEALRGLARSGLTPVSDAAASLR
jgi:hypothetical protein